VKDTADTVIRLSQVSKKFVLQRERPRSFHELAVRLARRTKNSRREPLWAVRDVDLAIASGEMVGLVGRNGAGKSTILKLVARIIEPTSGDVQVRGRVAALLELGAGFHPDLTGRENVFLNGSIMGLSRQEIGQRLDGIVAFSGLDRFIDVPVRQYSSGMYVRLAFSVAVHTEPDILLVDEVLAVGDAPFQHKCLERVHRMRQDGVTMLFVSHDPDAVRRVCQRAIWLDSGKKVADGDATTVVTQYSAHTQEESIRRASAASDRRWGTHRVEIEKVCLVDDNGETSDVFTTGLPLVVEIHYLAPKTVEKPVFGVAIHGSDGTHVTGPNTRVTGFPIPSIAGRGVVRYRVAHLPLLEGAYRVSAAVHNWRDTEMYDYHDRLYPFRVARSEGEKHGIVAIGGEWSWDAGTQASP
jgi:lipopolysaccharide transport system ATP-binding protein